MTFKILYSKDHVLWNSILAQIPVARKSPYFAPEYYRLFEERKEGRAVCFIGEDNGNIIMYPTLLNSINDLDYELSATYYDIQGAYGYNGPITNSRDNKLHDRFSKAILDYCNRSGIIAEFIRFCPLIENHEYLNYMQPFHILDNVYIDITLGIDHIWDQCFDGGVRKSVRKAVKADLSFTAINGGRVTEEDINNFLHIYQETMAKKEADEYYYFQKSFLVNLFRDLPKQTLLAFAVIDGKTISTEIILFNSKYAYGFLGGTLSDYYRYAPNSYLRYEIIKYMYDLGVKKYSIGAGKAKEDSVFKYKKSFSKNIESNFYVGKFVHNESIYNDIVKQWSRKYPEKTAKLEGILLKYRY